MSTLKERWTLALKSHTQTEARRHAKGLGVTQKAVVAAWLVSKSRSYCRTDVSTIGRRTPGSFARAWLERVLRRAYKACQFRRAKSHHDVFVHFGDDPGAESEVVSSWAGLPSSYHYPVNSSTHRIRVRADWLVRVKTHCGAVITTSTLGACLVLDVRPPQYGGVGEEALVVRQGRGCGLRVDRCRLYRDSDGVWTLGAFPKAWGPTAYNRVLDDDLVDDDEEGVADAADAAARERAALEDQMEGLHARVFGEVE